VRLSESDVVEEQCSVPISIGINRFTDLLGLQVVHKCFWCFTEVFVGLFGISVENDFLGFAAIRSERPLAQHLSFRYTAMETDRTYLQMTVQTRRLVHDPFPDSTKSSLRHPFWFAHTLNFHFRPHTHLSEASEMNGCRSSDLPVIELYLWAKLND